MYLATAMSRRHKTTFCFGGKRKEKSNQISKKQFPLDVSQSLVTFSGGHGNGNHGAVDHDGTCESDGNGNVSDDVFAAGAVHKRVVEFFEGHLLQRERKKKFLKKKIVFFFLFVFCFWV